MGQEFSLKAKYIYAYFIHQLSQTQITHISFPNILLCYSMHGGHPFLPPLLKRLWINTELWFALDCIYINYIHICFSLQFQNELNSKTYTPSIWQFHFNFKVIYSAGVECKKNTSSGPRKVLAGPIFVG